VFCARLPGRENRTHQLWSLDRILRDPIEKKPLYHFLLAHPVLSFAPPAATWRQVLPELGEHPLARSGELCAAASPAKSLRRRQRHGCPSVAMTYNDPVVFHEYAIDVADAATSAASRPWQ